MSDSSNIIIFDNFWCEKHVFVGVFVRCLKPTWHAKVSRSLYTLYNTQCCRRFSKMSYYLWRTTIFKLQDWSHLCFMTFLMYLPKKCTPYRGNPFFIGNLICRRLCCRCCHLEKKISIDILLKFWIREIDCNENWREILILIISHNWSAFSNTKTLTTKRKTSKQKIIIEFVLISRKNISRMKKLLISCPTR